jgi:hypothetical protein
VTSETFTANNGDFKKAFYGTIVGATCGLILGLFYNKKTRVSKETAEMIQ